MMIAYTSAAGGSNSRQIIPVAFADNLLRWHLRAYDRKRQKFVDFVLARIGRVRLIEHDGIEHHEHPDNDKQWHSFVDLKIKAHPHNLVDADSFDMGKNIRCVRIRAAMAGYFLRLWNVDCSQDTKLRGKEYQYYLENMSEVAELADLELAPGYVKER